MSQSVPVTVRREGAIARLTFERPPRLNALDREVAEAFAAGCRRVAADPTTRCVVIAGAGRAFMGGFVWPFDLRKEAGAA